MQHLSAILTNQPADGQHYVPQLSCKKLILTRTFGNGILSEHPFFAQHLTQFFFVEIQKDGAVDVKGGCDLEAVAPRPHLAGCREIGGDVHLGVRDILLL